MTASKKLNIAYAADASGVKKGVAEIGSVNESMSKKVSGLWSGVGKDLIAAFSVAAVVEFGKQSLEAFDLLEVSTKRLEFGLEKLGQTSALQPILDWARSFSLATGINETEIVDMASKLTVMGAAFFKAMGPQAAGWVDKMTQGLMDMSAATGKTASMLMRSLGPAILNAPAKAIPVLEKYGAMTKEQGQNVLDLVSAGKMQAATQAEITAIQEKYNGAAAQTAPLTKILANYWNQLNIVVGAFISKGLKVLVGWITNMNPLLRQWILILAGVTLGAVLLGAALKSDVVAGIVAGITAAVGYMVSLAALVVEEGVAATASMVLGSAFEAMSASAGPFVIAAAAVVVALVKIHGLMQQSSNEAKTWSADILSGKYTLDQLNGAVDKVTAGGNALSNMWNGNNITTGAYKDTLLQLLQTYSDTPGVISAAAAKQAAYDILTGNTAEATKILNGVQARYNATLKSSTTHLDAAGHATANFAHMTTDALTQVKSSADSTILSIGGVAKTSNKTAATFLKDMNTMEKEAQKSAKSMNELAHQNWVNEGYKAWLVQQGPAAINNFEALTHKQQLKTQQDWSRSTGFVQQYNNVLDGIPNTVTTTVHVITGAAMAAINSVINAARQIGNMPLHVPPPHGASGGIVTRPTYALIGEAGPEAVVPLNRMPGASALPHGGGGGGQPIIIHVAGSVISERELLDLIQRQSARNARRNGGRSGITA